MHILKISLHRTREITLDLGKFYYSTYYNTDHHSINNYWTTTISDTITGTGGSSTDIP